MTKNAIHQLHDILMQERKAALRGEFDSLLEIAKTKEVAFGDLQGMALARDEMRELAADVSRNQSIMESAILGVKSAYAHIDASKTAAQQVSVYNRKGALEVFDNRPARQSQKY